MSLAGPAGSPRACSGLMYCGVPITAPVAVNSSAEGPRDNWAATGSGAVSSSPNRFARPQSITSVSP